MTVLRILVANSTEAYIYQSQKAKLLNGDGALSLVAEFTHPQSRLKNSELESDRHGSYVNVASNHRSSTLAETSNLKELEVEAFAKQLVDVLEQSRIAKDFGELILIAPPAFHGILNKHLNNHLKQLVFKNIEKDYTKVKGDALVERLTEHL